MDNKIKELTIKEKILKSLEEPNKNSGCMISGFIGILIGSTVASLGITTQKEVKINE